MDPERISPTPPKTLRLAPDSELGVALRDASLSGEPVVVDAGDYVYRLTVSPSPDLTQGEVDLPALMASLRRLQESFSGVDLEQLRDDIRRWRGDGPGSTPEQVRETFELRDEPAIARFLERHPQVADGALLAADGLRARFGPDAQLALEVDTDPEDDLAQPRLFALVLTELEVEDALARLDAFHRQWWKKTTPALTEWLGVDVEMH